MFVSVHVAKRECFTATDAPALDATPNPGSFFMAVPQSTARPTESPSTPFVEGDIVRYVGTTHRTFTVARCYARTINGETRWIVEERNADSHDVLDLELVRRKGPTTETSIVSAGSQSLS
jgi:hypothetical protein